LLSLADLGIADLSIREVEVPAYVKEFDARLTSLLKETMKSPPTVLPFEQE